MNLMQVDVIDKESYFFPQREMDSSGYHPFRVAGEHWGPEMNIRRSGLHGIGLFYVFDGAGELKGNGKTYRLLPGTIFNIGPYGEHHFHCDTGATMQVLLTVYHGKDALTASREAFGGSNIALTLSHPTQVQGLMEIMLSQAAARSLHAREVCGHLLQSLLLIIADDRRGQTGAIGMAHLTYLRCRRYLEEHHESLRGVGEAARACGIDGAYLSRLFQRFASSSAQNYLTELKLSHASHLLLDSDLSIKEISSHLGFSDQYVFSRTFKRHRGCSPSLYRKEASR